MFKRTLKLLLYLFMSSFIIFLLVEKTSGNPAILYLQRHGYTHISQENIEAAQHQLGLGHHVILRYLDWVAHAFTGDLGYSFSTREPVTSMIIQSLTPTLTLMIVATAILLPLGFAIGYVVGVNPGHKWRIMLRSIAQILTSMPEYWLAILFVYYFGIRLQWLPFVGSSTWLHFVLPVTVLVIVEGCHIILMTAHLIEGTLKSDAYQLTLLRGFKLKHRIYVQIKDIIAPLITIMINSMIHLFGKVVILEVIFSMSGIGKLLITAINQRDYPVIQGVIMIVIVAIMVTNYLGDILMIKNEPRIQHKQLTQPNLERMGNHE